MIFFFQAIFLSIIILHQNNIWVTLIPYPSATFLIIGTTLFWFGLIRRNFFLRNLPLQAFIVLVLILVTQLLIGMESGAQQTSIYRSMLRYALLTIMCIGIISQWRPAQEKYAIKLFVVISTGIAFLGIVAWLIVNLTWIYDGVIDPAHFIDLEQFSGGKMTRLHGDGNAELKNDWGIFANTYSFPYSLGLVLTNSYLYEFAGIEFFRASGFFHEPVTTWFMTIPAIVLITSGSLFSTNVRRLLITVQILFLFAAFSLSIMFSLVLIYIFRQMLYSVLDISTSFARLKPFLLVAMVGVGIWVIQYLAADYNYKGYWSGMNVVLSRLHSNNYLEIVFNNFFNPSTVLLYIYLLAQAFH